MSNPSDPARGGQEPDDRSRQGQPDGGQVAPQPGAPHQYPPGQYPQQGPYGQPGAYPPPGQYGPQQGQYGQYQPPAHGQPYGDRGGYVYSPYGSQPYPAGTAGELEKPAARPGTMILALVLIIISAIPFLLAAIVPAMLPADPGTLPPDVQAQLDQLGYTYADLLSLFRVLAVVMAAIALLYILFAALAFRGMGWARVVMTIMTVGFAVLLLYSAFGPVGGNSTTVVFALVVLVLSVGGTALFFTPDAARYYAGRR